MTTGSIYFVTDGHAIKIGFSTKSLRKRIAEVQTGHPFPLFLMGSIEGTWHDEQRIHQQFAQLRLTGEWFAVHPTLTDFIDDLQEAGRLSPGDDLDEHARRVEARPGMRFRV